MSITSKMVKARDLKPGDEIKYSGKWVKLQNTFTTSIGEQLMDLGASVFNVNPYSAWQVRYVEATP